MTHRITGFLCNLAGLILLSCVVLLWPCASSVRAEVVLKAFYDPSNGNIRMASFNESTGVLAPLNVSTFQFISPALYLSGSAAAIPSNPMFTVFNTATSTVVSPDAKHAEIYATTFAPSEFLFSNGWDLGNVAALGLTQSQIHDGFTTPNDDDILHGGPHPGHFIYQVQGTTSFSAGSITAVPEPSALMLLVVACFGLTCRRLKTVAVRKKA